MNLQNKVALITGGARIGITIAEEFSKKGCHVALSYRSSRSSSEEAARRVEKHGSKALLFQADVTVDPQVKSLIQDVMQKFGGLDIVVNMASIYEETPFEKLSESVWQKNIDANLKSAFLTVLYAAPHLQKNEGRVINFSDWIAA